MCGVFPHPMAMRQNRFNPSRRIPKDTYPRILFLIGNILAGNYRNYREKSSLSIQLGRNSIPADSANTTNCIQSQGRLRLNIRRHACINLKQLYQRWSKECIGLQQDPSIFDKYCDRNLNKQQYLWIPRKPNLSCAVDRFRIWFRYHYEQIPPRF